MLCLFHDVSHLAHFKTNRKKNIFDSNFILSAVGGWGLMNSFMWSKHHVYAHHSFTGIFGKDPDTLNGHPFFRKSELDLKINKMFLSFF